MYKVLVVMDVLEEHKLILEAVSSDIKIEYIPARLVTPKDVEFVDMIIGNLNPQLLKYCKKLKLLQLNNAGTEGFTTEGILPSGALLANATGAYGLAISEHMIASLLCLMKKLDLYRMNQLRKKWNDEGPVPAIYWSKTLIVGFGDIGNEFGIRMHALGSRITAIRKNVTVKPEYVESIHTMNDFYTCLSEADIVATCLPGYSDTFNVFDKKAFEAMKDGAYFLNVGRGTAVDTEAICDALESGKLAGAALDVTNPEPLPPNHRLWTMQNVLITPHVSGGYHVRATHDKIVQIAANNLLHLVNQEMFENIVDMSIGYRINQNFIYGKNSTIFNM